MSTEQQEKQYTQILDVDDAPDLPTVTAEGQQKEMSFKKMYELLKTVDSIIVTIPNETVGELKRGITNVKYQENDRNRRAGLPVDDRRIEYKITAKDDNTAQVRITFITNAITLLDIKTE